MYELFTVYRCRLCQTTEETSTHFSVRELPNLGDGVLYREHDSCMVVPIESTRCPLTMVNGTRLHYCEDNAIGVADLQGVRFKKKETPEDTSP